MMCYRDRTYCAGPCATADCSRQITDEVTDAANRACLPLAVMDLRAGCSAYAPPAPSAEGTGTRDA
jgi:hypothetical protein